MRFTIDEWAQIIYDVQCRLVSNYQQGIREYPHIAHLLAEPEELTYEQIITSLKPQPFSMKGVVTGHRRKWNRNR